MTKARFKEIRAPKKINGIRAYKLARRKLEFKLEKKKIEILNAKIQSEYLREEVNIINAINNIEKTHDYLKMLSQRSSLKDITFEFFENLKINDSDPLIKNRRLSILALLRAKLLDIGDLSKLEGY